MKKKSGKKTLELSFYRKNLFIQIRRSNVKSHCEASYSQKSFNKSPLIVEERLILRMRQDDPTIKANNEQFTDNLSSELRIYVLLFLLYQYFLTLKNVIFVSQPPISMRIVKFQKKNCKSLAKFVRQILLFKNLKGAESMGPF
ncbi:unnamed protein product [Rhizophagus irregularis]|nr:unnamed protein product [Rhizophagus irregularis]